MSKVILSSCANCGCPIAIFEHDLLDDRFCKICSKNRLADRIAALESENAALKAAIRWVRTTTYQMFDHPDDGGASHTRADFDPENWESAHPIVRELLEGDK